MSCLDHHTRRVGLRLTRTAALATALAIALAMALATAFAAALAPLGAGLALAQETPSDSLLTASHYLDWERVADPQISPDGTQVVYTRQWVDQLKDRWASALWIMGADGSRNRFLVEGSQARWSPDGTRIAYLASDGDDHTQIFARWMDGSGAASQLTRVNEAPANLRWSPDGRSIAFTMLTAKKTEWKIDLPAAPEGAKWTEGPRLIESTAYRADREGFLKEAYTHIYVVDADSGTPRQLTEGDWNVGGRTVGIPEAVGVEWTPDGRELVFDGLKEKDADRRYMESHIYSVDVATRAVRQITTVKGPWTAPAVSHDGRTIAFTGYEWSPQTYRAAELYVIGRDGSGMRKLSGDLDRDPDNLRWAQDDSGVYFTADDRGSSNVWFAAIKGGARQLTAGVQMLGLSSVSPKGVAVGVRSSPGEPGDVVRYSLPAAKEIVQLTRVNADVLQAITLGAFEEIWATSPDGTKVQGWLVEPPGFDPAKKYPLILHIHGGPHAMYSAAFNYAFRNLAANGYLVLYTNPRGSTGYGTAFGNAIDDSYPGVDYDDLMAAVDATVARGCVDVRRMYVTGVSGGGVLSAWLTSHTNRFAAAAVRSPVTDWISFAGTTDITSWGYTRYRKPFWEDPAKWLQHSPVMHVATVKTPTLLMTGELDLRTPMGQTEEYYQALKAVGVETVMLRFNGEYHGTGSKPSNFMRTQLYLVSWFGRHTKPQETAAAGR
jgi:dipeptidyl aminopeptidase/acylaminoacyl peptidase